MNDIKLNIDIRFSQKQFIFLKSALLHISGNCVAGGPRTPAVRPHPLRSKAQRSHCIDARFIKQRLANLYVGAAKRLTREATHASTVSWGGTPESAKRLKDSDDVNPSHSFQWHRASLENFRRIAWRFQG
jgi:hypothetical protein